MQQPPQPYGRAPRGARRATFVPAPEDGAGRRGRHRASRATYVRRRAVAALGGALAIVLVAGIAFAAVVSLRVVQNIDENAVARPGAPTEALGDTDGPDWHGAVNLLIMGSDTRDGQVSGDYGDVGGARSDVMMLLHVAEDRESATLVSIPRDTMVAAPECTTEDGRTVPARQAVQINGLLDQGPFCALDAVAELTGLPLEHFIVVGFDGVIGMTEAIGGVEVCVDRDVDDPYSGLQLAAGTHEIEGEQALAFLRTRHGFGDGSDLGRIEAQQAFLASLARKVKAAGTLSNPAALYGLADAASRAVTVDEGLADPTSLVALAGTLADIDLDRLVMVQLPVEAYPSNRNRVQATAEADALFASLRDDRPLTLQAEAPAGAEGATAAPSGSAEATPTPTRTSTEDPAASSSPLELGPDAVGQTAEQVRCAS
ncbi:LCP family protein [Agrococcus terreus]|uniref:Cell envelope-related transcriptional attenuator domain-containing protein n=1 Tax=Agrococcus terreus TaxID=574649 RepID=A0ABQ2KDD7_9MICO|nr:LCP family protein [Agrococcus terreus]GGN77471.1 hypothetical protein GCM10010968_02080 [Agrococcus terreus]